MLFAFLLGWDFPFPLLSAKPEILDEEEELYFEDCPDCKFELCCLILVHLLSRLTSGGGGADWCSHCGEIIPSMEKMKNRMKHEIMRVMMNMRMPELWGIGCWYNC